MLRKILRRAQEGQMINGFNHQYAEDSGNGVNFWALLLPLNLYFSFIL
ncbi:hypothetical protein DB41_IP00160 [Neochlamydia sp. TUME1]|nr:hypothetical protein DB41_IP00160 [Neochlamydia sp. TUME1]